MWEVVAECRETGRERKIVTTNWDKAKLYAMRAIDKKWKARIREVYTDVLIADGVTGDFLVCRRKIRPTEAVRYSLMVTKEGRNCGCLIWPHGWKLPASWNVTKIGEGP